jgi:hypothetical protein
MDLNGDGLLDRLCVNGNEQWHAAYGEPGQVQFTGYSSCSGAGNWSVPNSRTTTSIGSPCRRRSDVY